jgi:hypothetical protein
LSGNGRLLDEVHFIFRLACAENVIGWIGGELVKGEDSVTICIDGEPDREMSYRELFDLVQEMTGSSD